MAKIIISFLETENWEAQYLRDHIAAWPVAKNLLLNFFPHPLNKGTLAKIKKTDILVPFIYSRLDQATLQQLSALKFIATMSTGFDHIDLAACDARGIKISNIPSYGENTVAEHTFALILNLSRKIIDSVERVRQNDFSPNGLRGFDLKNKTLGIVGLGHIGQCVAQIAAGFQMKVLAFDPRRDAKLAKTLKLKYVTLKALLKNSDIITLHAPDNSATHHLINKDNIKTIKKGAYLINTARGGLVETEALLWALKNGVLAGAGLDVFEEESFIKEEKELLSKSFQNQYNLKTILQNHVLINNRKILITPHNAFNSNEALQRILDTTLENIRGFLNKRPKNLVK